MTKLLFLKGLAIVLFVFALSGCSVFDDIYVSGDTEALPKIKYMKDMKGNCFAYTSSRTHNGYIVFSVSQTSCTSAGL
jgi:hypothetical protein